jgi:hypothetical protein
VTFEELEAAPVLRGTVRGDKWPGVTKGTGLDSPTRQANAVALQEAINHAVNNRMYFELDYGDYEIESATGLTVGGRLTWRSPLHATIHQAATNAPILTIGVVGSSPANNEIFGMDIEGGTLHYMSDQAANSNANALVLGNLWLSRIANFRISNTITNNRSYRGIYIPQGLSFFSNTLENLKVFRSGFSLLHISNFGTGNSYNNIYLSGVTTSAVAGSVTSPFLWEMSGSQQTHDSNFNQLNIEWCIANILMKLTNVRGANFNSVHMEQNRLTNSTPSFVLLNIANASFNGLTLLDNRVEASIASGSPSLFRFSGESTATVNNLPIIINSSSYVDLPLNVSFQGTDPAFSAGRDQNPGSVTVENLRVLDGVGTSLRDNIRPDHTLDPAQFGPLSTSFIRRISTGTEPGAQIEGMTMELIGNYTLYGAYAKNAWIRFPAALTANATLTLSNVMGPSGTQFSGVPVPDGTMLSVRRRTGTGTNALTINNWNGNALVSADTTVGTTWRLKFSAGNWSLIT